MTLKLFWTFANSMVSKQVLFIINYIHSKFWNCLTIEYMHKLQNIFIKKCALENMEPKK